MQLPVHVRWKAATGKRQQAQGRTANLSGNGLFITIPARLRLGTQVTFSVQLPAEVTRVPMELICRGEVVRQRRKGSQRGIAAIIDDYQLRPKRRLPN
ncbi:MAG: PilZ domain-containing protein [Acidobacteriia bacterium]|nr:PilZ domain-containing protein [Terriglobia bacterium]